MVLARKNKMCNVLDFKGNQVTFCRLQSSLQVEPKVTVIDGINTLTISYASLYFIAGKTWNK